MCRELPYAISTTSFYAHKVIPEALNGYYISLYRYDIGVLRIYVLADVGVAVPHLSGILADVRPGWLLPTALTGMLESPKSWKHSNRGFDT